MPIADCGTVYVTVYGELQVANCGAVPVADCGIMLGD